MSRDATMDELAIEGCTLKLRVEGRDAGPALVLSHMLGTDLSLWDNVVSELGRHFRVIRYDTRGHGGSDLGDAPVTVDRLGRDVVALLDALGIERAHFCGESMGGAVGLWLLAHAPARIERAVIAGSAARLGTPAIWNARIAAALADGMEQAVEPTIKRWLSTAFVERAPEPVEAIRAMVRATSPAGYAACCAALRDMDLREALRGVTVPVLVLRGADDPSVTAEDLGYLVETMVSATAAEVDAWHCASIESEAAFSSAVVSFLTAKNAPRRRPAGKASSTRAKPSATQAKASTAQAKPTARRAGSRVVVAARRPVARTAPVSAKGSAIRKTAARAAPPAPSRRRTAPKPTRAAAPKTAARKEASSKPQPPKPAKGRLATAKAAAAKPLGRAKVASGKNAPAASARRAPVIARKPVSRAKPTAAVLRAAARTKTAGALTKKATSGASSKPKASTIESAAESKTSAKAAKTMARASGSKTPAKPAPGKKTTAAKNTSIKPAASRRGAAPAKPSRSPGRGLAGSGRRKS